MSKINSILLFVTDVAASTQHYARILQQEPLNSSPTFAIFVLPSGLGLGLWAKDTVKPDVASSGGGCDIGFKVDSNAEVDQYYADWKDRGADILLPPTDLDFGRSFVTVDSDGHRLRVYSLND